MDGQWDFPGIINSVRTGINDRRILQCQGAAIPFDIVIALSGSFCSDLFTIRDRIHRGITASCQCRIPYSDAVFAIRSRHRSKWKRYDHQQTHQYGYQLFLHSIISSFLSSDFRISASHLRFSFLHTPNKVPGV